MQYGRDRIQLEGKKTSAYYSLESDHFHVAANQNKWNTMDRFHHHTIRFSLFSSGMMMLGRWYLLVTGFPVKSKNCNSLHDCPIACMTDSDDTLLNDSVKEIKFGIFLIKLFPSILSIRLFDANKFDSRCHRLKLSKRISKLLHIFNVSNSSPPPPLFDDADDDTMEAVFSIAGMPYPFNINSRSPKQLVRCSARFSKSTVSLIVVSAATCIYHSKCRKNNGAMWWGFCCVVGCPSDLATYDVRTEDVEFNATLFSWVQENMKNYDKDKV